MKTLFPYKSNTAALSERFLQPLKRNYSLVSAELKENQELFVLLMKSRKEQLTDVEKERVKSQTRELLKVIPITILTVLPGSFLTLPLLFLIIPKENLLPRSFLKNEQAAMA